MKSLMKSIDIFSFHIDFNYENQRFFHSKFGFSLSFLIYFSLIFFLYYFSKDFINKTNPIVMFKENEFTKDMNFPLNDFFKKFSLSFDFNDTTNLFGDFYQNGNVSFIKQNPIWYLQLIIFNNQNGTYDSFIFDEKLTIRKYRSYYKCESTIELDEDSEFLFKTAESYSNPYKQNRKDYELKNLKDENLKINQDSSIAFNIVFDQSFIKRIQYKSLNISLLYFSYTISDNIMNVENEEFFTSFNMLNDLKIISMDDLILRNSYGIDEYIFQSIELKDDFGFILTEESNIIKLKKVSSIKSKSQFYLSYEYPSFIPVFKINFERIMKVYERRYKKLQNVLADLGGLINSLIIIGKILIFSFNENKFYYELVNRLFNSESLGDLNENKKSNFVSRLEKKGLNCNPNEIFKKKENISYRSISRLDHSNIILKSEADLSRIKKNTQRLDFISYNSNRKKNEKMSENCENSSMKVKNSSKHIKSNIELPMYGKNLLNELEKNKSELFDNELKIKIKIDQFINLKNKKKRIIKFNCGEFFKLIIFYKNFKDGEFLKKEKIFEHLSNKIKGYMNIVNYCFLFENIEKLKQILLNPIQNFSLNFLNSGQIDIHKKDNLEIELQKTFEYFNNNKDGLNEIDKRIVNNISLDFLNFLN